MIATCHPNRFVFAKGLCKSCYDKDLRSRNREYAARQRKNTEQWHKEHKQEVKANQVRWRRKQDPMMRRNSLLRRKYGIDHADYLRILETQAGACKLCFRKPGDKYFHIDHDHKTGIVRGVLCHQCNWYLGIVEHDTLILQRITKYLEPR